MRLRRRFGALRRRYGRASAGDRARWDKLRAQYIVAYQAERDLEIAMRVKYGDKNYRMWASRGERSKLEKLDARTNKIGDKLIELLVKVSPRGEAWLTGAPSWWLREKLSWEDATRPSSEPLSVEVPAPYGRDRGLT